MRQIPVSQFKANCSALAEQVRKTRSIQITHRGKVIAEIRPLPSEKRKTRWAAPKVGHIVSAFVDLESIAGFKD
jgi:antitoxin (DNA-binding transcriptional repressor) of toxin-antitoxin stability system